MPRPAALNGSTSSKSREIDASGSVCAPIRRESSHGDVRNSRPFPLGPKRGAMTTGMDRSVHPTRLKQLARHKT